jgi:hypothetical protein
MQLSQLITDLEKMLNDHGDMPVVMDEGRQGDIADCVTTGEHGARSNCHFSVLSQNNLNAGQQDAWINALKQSTKYKSLPVMLINIEF